MVDYGLANRTVMAASSDSHRLTDITVFMQVKASLDSLGWGPYAGGLP
jgi:hypothetical protein